MASSLFGNQGGSSLIQALNSARSIIGGNPQAAFNTLMQQNPQFAAFARANMGKTPEQAFRDYGYDYNAIKGMF